MHQFTEKPVLSVSQSNDKRIRVYFTNFVRSAHLPEWSAHIITRGPGHAGRPHLASDFYHAQVADDNFREALIEVAEEHICVFEVLQVSNDDIFSITTNEAVQTQVYACVQARSVPNPPCAAFLQAMKKQRN